jgi:UDP-N-acetylmuramoyl-tripeptide--D-alanyl-D-alanine ligase
MAELGAHSEAAHAEVGKFAAESGVQQLFAVGKMAALMADAARAAGCPGVAVFADVKSAADAVKEFLQPGDVMLMKASRATRLEQLTEILESGASKKV